jgi:xanthine dehydrogenase FAD-binding subunit
MKVYNPQSIDEALELLNALGEEVKVLAGGTDLVVHYKQGKIKLDQVCNLSGIEELSYIREKDDELWVGPLVTHAELVNSSLIKQYAGALAQAAALVGSPQIRNKGTIGGNIGTASPAGDTLPALVCLNARLVIENRREKRVVPIRRFFQGPGEHILAYNEVITGIIIPKLKEDHKSGYVKLGARNASAIAIASVAVKARKSQNVLSGVEAAFGSVGPTVLYFSLPVLEGINPTLDGLWDRVQFIRDEVNAITDIRATKEYRQEMAVSLLYRALQSL